MLITAYGYRFNMNTGLYSSSRTLYAISRKYGGKFLRDTLGRTNPGHTPLPAIFVSAVFSLLALCGLIDHSFNQVGFCSFPFLISLQMLRDMQLTILLAYPNSSSVLHQLCCLYLRQRVFGIFTFSPRVSRAETYLHRSSVSPIE